MYILGDISWYKDDKTCEIFERLDGRKVLIKGNHDRVHGKIKNYFEEITDYKEIKAVLKDYDFVEVTTTDLLTVDFAKSVNATAMLRGLRMVSDFEYELQMATMNKCLDDDIETVFIMSSHEYSFLSSSSVKEIAKFNGDYSQFVPDVVRLAIEKKMNR